MRTARILFVEDDPDDIELLTKSLQENGIQDFLILDTGAKAFTYLDELAEDELPELIVVDLNMPGISGFEVIRTLKATERFQNIPVFILTTSQRTALIDEALKGGAAGYYRKPATVRELNALVQELYQLAS